MVPIDHARLSARDFGGEPEDYLKLHEFFDQSKYHCTDFRHRAILHNTMGLAIAEQVFGPTIRNSNGCDIPTRELSRRHIMEDCGQVPTVKEWLDALGNRTEATFNRTDRREVRWLKENFYQPAEAT